MIQVIPSITEMAVVVGNLLRGREASVTKEELVEQYIKYMTRQRHSINGRLAQELVRLYGE